MGVPSWFGSRMTWQPNRMESRALIRKALVNVGLLDYEGIEMVKNPIPVPIQFMHLIDSLVLVQNSNSTYDEI